MKDRSLFGSQFFDVAVQHLERIDDQTSPEMMRIHCHFALMFVQLGLQRSVISPRLDVVPTANHHRVEEQRLSS